MMLGRYISRAASSENRREPSASLPSFRRTAIHLAQSVGVVQMPPAAAAESQFQTSAMDCAIWTIGPWVRSGGPTRAWGRADFDASARRASGTVSVMPTRSRMRVWMKVSHAMPDTASSTAPATTNIRLQ